MYTTETKQKPNDASAGKTTKQSLFFQPKLSINEPGDIYEQEADAMADKVMRMPDSETAGHSFFKPAISSVQRKCAHCEAEEKKAMRKESNGSVSRIPGETESYISSLSGGEALTKETRSFFEPRFGLDFSNVRLHTGSVAAKSAQSVNALAYTSGNNIVFNEGQYSPDTDGGKRLLGHELTHVVQQSNRLQLKEFVQRADLTDDEIDIEADEAGLSQDAGNLEDVPAEVSKENDESGDTGEALTQKTTGRSAGGNVCSAGDCPQGKQRSVVRNDCSTSNPVSETNFITSLEVTIASQNLHVTWSDGRTEDWPCSPNPSHTPRGSDVVGVKCSIRHTNLKKDGMAWFTGFASQGLVIGFHDSQRVGTGIVSHGCVRVCCDKARIINQNTWSGRTTIRVS